MVETVLKTRSCFAAVLALLIGNSQVLADHEDTTSVGGTGEYQVVTAGTRSFTTPSGFSLKVLLEAANLGNGDIEIAELTFPANYRGSGHLHAPTEIFYVLSGEFTHVVNGRGAVLTPGMVGVVRPGDSVEHIVANDQPAKTLVIWVPGGLAENIIGDRETEAIEPIVTTPMGGEK